MKNGNLESKSADKTPFSILGNLEQAQRIEAIPHDAEHEGVYLVSLRNLLVSSGALLDKLYFDHAEKPLSPSQIKELRNLYHSISAQYEYLSSIDATDEWKNRIVSEYFNVRVRLLMQLKSAE